MSNITICQENGNNYSDIVKFLQDILHLNYYK